VFDGGDLRREASPQLGVNFSGGLAPMASMP
jgi:hypothetical protein